MKTSYIATIEKAYDGFEDTSTIVLHGVPTGLNNNFLHCLALLALWGNERDYYPADDEVISWDDCLDDFITDFNEYRDSLKDRADDKLSVKGVEELTPKEIEAFEILTPRLQVPQFSFSMLEGLFDYMHRFGLSDYYNDELQYTNSTTHKVLKFIIEKMDAGFDEFKSEWISDLHDLTQDEA